MPFHSFGLNCFKKFGPKNRVNTVPDASDFHLKNNIGNAKINSSFTQQKFSYTEKISLVNTSFYLLLNFNTSPRYEILFVSFFTA